MKFDYFAKRLGGYALAFFLLSGVAMIGGSTASAQWGRRVDDWRRDRNYNNGYQVARQQGYSYGMNAGAADAQRNRRFDPERSSIYKKGTDGYTSSYGNKGQYKQVFRDAFLQGYREGYQRFAYNDRYGRNDRDGRYDRNDRRRTNGRWVNGVWVPW